MVHEGKELSILYTRTEFHSNLLVHERILPQLINLSTMIALESQHFATPNEIMDLGKSSKLLKI